MPYPVLVDGSGQAYVEIADIHASLLVTYSDYAEDAQDKHTQYPTGMRVWKLSVGDGGFVVTEIPEFTDLLRYSGCSIRVTGKKGIRMITSIGKDKKADLVSDGLAGYTLKEYGTVVAWASQLSEEKPLVMGKSYVKSNYAYKKYMADPIFAYDGDQMQYTNVLVGFSLDQCRDDIAMRPYMILENTEGLEITLYGGIVQRSIGYIAKQNANTFDPTTQESAYNYVWDIIHHVYGEDYVPSAA